MEKDFQVATADSTPLPECSKCHQTFPLTSKYFRPTRSGNFRTSCRECTRKYNNQYYQGNRDSILEQKAQDRLDRPEFYAEQNRKHKEDPIEKAVRAKKYREENPEKVKAQLGDWRRRNPVHIKTYSAEYYIENKDKILVRKRSTYRKNPTVYILIGKKSKATRRAQKRQAGGNFTKSDLLRMYDEQEQRCAYCGTAIYWGVLHDIHIDHVLPLSRGGSNNPDNLALTCADCNLAKRNYLLDEWLITRGW